MWIFPHKISLIRQFYCADNIEEGHFVHLGHSQKCQQLWSCKGLAQWEKSYLFLVKHFNPFPPLHISCCSWKYSFNQHLSVVLYFLPIAVETKPLLGGRAFYLLCLIVTPFSLMTQKKILPKQR